MRKALLLFLTFVLAFVTGVAIRQATSSDEDETDCIEEVICPYFDELEMESRTHARRTIRT